MNIIRNGYWWDEIPPMPKIDFSKYCCTIKRIFPNLWGQKLLDVQPMTGSRSTVFYLQYFYKDKI